MERNLRERFYENNSDYYVALFGDSLQRLNTSNPVGLRGAGMLGDFAKIVIPILTNSGTAKNVRGVIGVLKVSDKRPAQKRKRPLTEEKFPLFSS